MVSPIMTALLILSIDIHSSQYLELNAQRAQVVAEKKRSWQYDYAKKNFVRKRGQLNQPKK